jgi:hypothetical protein
MPKAIANTNTAFAARKRAKRMATASPEEGKADTGMTRGKRGPITGKTKLTRQKVFLLAAKSLNITWSGTAGVFLKSGIDEVTGTKNDGQ